MRSNKEFNNVNNNVKRTTDGVVDSGAAAAAASGKAAAADIASTAKAAVSSKINLFGISRPKVTGAPIGAIIMWSNENIPPGWKKCDGTKYGKIQTPNLQGRFIVGAGQLKYKNGSTGGTYSQQDPTGSIGKEEGAEKVKLTEATMPSHSHGYTMKSNQESEVDEGSRNRTTPGTTSATTQQTGGGQAHENRPPYYVLSYIMYVGDY